MLRRKAHRAMDALLPNRRDRYRWLRDVLGVPQDKAHIGMCDAEQCRVILEAAAKAAKESDS